MAQEKSTGSVALRRLLAAAAVAATAGAAWYFARRKPTETPYYHLVLADRAFELRRYPPLIVAETLQPGAREDALEIGFGLLADYIFAESRNGEAIAMTTPVLVRPETERRWRVRLIMPARWTRETLPKPGLGISIVELPPRQVGAVRFAGRADDGVLERKEAELRRWMANHDIAAGPVAEHAFYHGPMVPGPLRRNEVLVPVA